MPRLITSTPAARFAAILLSSCANAYGGMRSRRLLGFMQLLCEVVAEAALEHGPRPACQVDAQVLPHLHLELAAVEDHRQTGAIGLPAAVLDVGDRGAAGTRAGGQGLPHPALEDPRSYPRQAVGLELRVPRHIGPVGELRVGFDGGADRRQVEYGELLGRLDVDGALWVADRDVAERPQPSPRADLAAPVLGAPGEVLGAELRPAHGGRAGVRPGDRRADLSGRGVDREGVLIGPPAAP